MNFDLIVATSFYDGPESGFVFYSSGEGLKFSVVGESRFPIFRAFGFALLDGNWSEMVNELIETSPRRSNGLLIFALESPDGVSTLISAVSAAKEQCYYLGVGRAYLNNIAMMAIANEDWESFFRFEGPKRLSCNSSQDQNSRSSGHRLVALLELQSSTVTVILDHLRTCFESRGREFPV